MWQEAGLNYKRPKAHTLLREVEGVGKVYLWQPTGPKDSETKWKDTILNPRAITNRLSERYLG